MIEIWKDICYVDSITGVLVDYTGLYRASNYGRVKALERIVTRRKQSGDFTCTFHEKILAWKNNGVYPTVALSKDGNSKYYTIHRIVASLFVDNQNNLPEVNHKDCNPMNPCADNLEWCDRSYNVSYNDSAVIRGIEKMKRVSQYTLDGSFIREWNSYKDAASALGLNRGNISNCVKGRCKTYGGYIWKAS